MNDNRIIELYFERSEDAIAETDRKYGGCCRSTAYSILGNREDSEECTNDTYLKIWNNIPPNRPARLGAFIMRIVRNLAIDMYRKRERLKSGGGYGSVSYDEIVECLPSSESAESAADRQAVLTAVEDFLRKLPKDKRVMFVRRYYFCGTYAEIAADMHTTEDGVRMSLKRTREKLRGYLEKEGVEI